MAVLDFSRDRKMMSVLVAGGAGGAFTLCTKVDESYDWLHMSECFA
jgi:hypothetical protein